MRKANIVWAIALMLAMFTGLALHQVNAVSAQGDSPVGVVVAYIPGVSITIIDQKGNQTEYALDPSLKIEPAEKADSLKVGSFVTIIAPASVDKQKQKTVGIVIHPDIPSGFKIPGWVATALVKNTPVPTNVPATATPKVSETPTPVGPDTATATLLENLTSTPMPPASAKEDGTTVQANAFIEWLRALFVQVLSRQ